MSRRTRRRAEPHRRNLLLSPRPRPPILSDALPKHVVLLRKRIVLLRKRITLLPKHVVLLPKRIVPLRKRIVLLRKHVNALRKRIVLLPNPTVELPKHIVPLPRCKRRVLKLIVAPPDLAFEVLSLTFALLNLIGTILTLTRPPPGSMYGPLDRSS